MKKITALVLSLSLAHPQGALLPLWAAEAPKAAELSSIEVGEDQVRIKLSAPVQHTESVTKTPPRLILELLNTEFKSAAKSVPGKGKVIKQVRSSQFAGPPNPSARVVLDLAEPVAYKVEESGNEILVRLAVAGAAPKEGKAPAPAQKAPAPAPKAPAPAPKAAAPVPAAEAAAALTGIDLEEDQLRLRLSAPAQFEMVYTGNPPRLVVDLKDTEFQMAARSLEGKGRFIKRVRSAQHKGQPSPVTRVVVDLNRPVDYKASVSGSDIVVRVGALAAAASAAPPAAQAPSGAAPPPPSKGPAPSVGVSTPTASRAERSAPAKRGAPEPGSMSTETSPELGEMATHATTAPKASAEAAEAPAEAPAASTTRKLRRDILASLPREPIPLQLENAEIGDVLNMLAARANLNIIYGPDVTGTLSLHLTDVPFNEAFNIILSMKGLLATQVGENTLQVMTPKELDKSRQAQVGVTRIFSLGYAKAADVKNAIDAVRQAEKRQGTTVVDAEHNLLIITETPEGLASVERLLSQLDTRPRQVLIEAKLVEVGLSKDLNFGIQWDYLGQYPTGSIGGQRAVNVVGSADNPLTTANPAQIDGLSPFDKTVARSVASGGRGTGVNLAADKIFGAFTFGRITNNYFLTATLTAAAAQGKVKVLSDPKIATINGKEAKINITTQIPFVTSTVSSTGVATQSVGYTTTGIQLSVTPQINADGRVTLKITPTVSKPSATTAAAGGTGAVAVDMRSADTNVIVRDGETIVIGGLITDSVTNNIAKVPLLGDIPILGWLFKKKSVVRTRVELLIFVTTKILPD